MRKPKAKPGRVDVDNPDFSESDEGATQENHAQFPKPGSRRGLSTGIVHVKNHLGDKFVLNLMADTACDEVNLDIERAKEMKLKGRVGSITIHGAAGKETVIPDVLFTQLDVLSPEGVFLRRVKVKAYTNPTGGYTVTDWSKER